MLLRKHTLPRLMTFSPAFTHSTAVQLQKWRELKDLGEALEEHVLKPRRAQGTRWINHRRKALVALAANYRSLSVHLLQGADEPGQGKVKLKAYWRQLTSSTFVLHMVLYQDLLAELSELSLDFQADELSLSSVRSRVVASQTALLRQREKPGPYLRPVLNAFTSTSSAGVFEFKGVAISHHSTSDEAFRHQRVEIVNRITDCISQRFATFSTDPVLLAAEIFDPHNMPENISAIDPYGDEEVQRLCEHFEPLLLSNGCNVAEVEREWLRAKHDIHQHHRREAFFVLWHRMLTEKEAIYPNLLRIVLVFPVSTAHVERQFSTIKRIQGDWRLRLKMKTIEDLLLIKSQGCDPLEYQSE
ncbi:hypothetical protein KUCAC02_025527 [Chaenocephalus aceratus]|uniref:Uncharacterized protein n=1 Tax=Chaenocephalus aceratus TaxID=36190 RepID=A0ACB9VUW2_CHAAC|nr:hypothetical protein KUCAC02_025527 [Chaenocephalus aceratus]